MSFLQSIKSSIKLWANKQREYKQAYNESFDEAYKTQLKLKAKKDAYNKVNNKTSRNMKIGLLKDDDQKPLNFKMGMED